MSAGRLTTSRRYSTEAPWLPMGWSRPFSSMYLLSVPAGLLTEGRSALQPWRRPATRISCMPRDPPAVKYLFDPAWCYHAVTQRLTSSVCSVLRPGPLAPDPQLGESVGIGSDIWRGQRTTRLCCLSRLCRRRRLSLLPADRASLRVVRHLHHLLKLQCAYFLYAPLKFCCQS